MAHCPRLTGPASKARTRLLPILALSAAIAAAPASADELPRLRSYGAPGDLWRQVERIEEQREREADAWRDLDRDLQLDRIERRLDTRPPLSAYERNKEILR